MPKYDKKTNEFREWFLDHAIDLLILRREDNMKLYKNELFYYKKNNHDYPYFRVKTINGQKNIVLNLSIDRTIEMLKYLYTNADFSRKTVAKVLKRKKTEYNKLFQRREINAIMDSIF